MVISCKYDSIDNPLLICIRCYNAETEFKFTFISFNTGVKGRESGCYSSVFFDLCSGLILEIHSFVHPVSTAPWQMEKVFCVSEGFIQFSFCAASSNSLMMYSVKI